MKTQLNWKQMKKKKTLTCIKCEELRIKQNKRQAQYRARKKEQCSEKKKLKEI